MSLVQRSNLLINLDNKKSVAKNYTLLFLRLSDISLEIPLPPRYHSDSSLMADGKLYAIC
jgi:hypothetical protein